MYLTSSLTAVCYPLFLNPPAHYRAYAALIAVYFFWGTTYLGIRMALEMFPPAVLLSVRYLISGAIMVAGASQLKAEFPKGRELWRTMLFGTLTIGGGNGALVFAEQWIPSGLAALFVTTSPFWMVGLEALLPGGTRLHLPTLAGILVGFLGALSLIAPGAATGSFDTRVLQGFLVLQLGSLSWCLGSLLQRRQRARAHPIVSGAVQQLAAGVACLPAALLVPHPPIHWQPRAMWALAYLVVFGSLIGYSSFVYAMEHLPVAITSTYAFVNPLVAVWLGSLFYQEPFGWRESIAMTAIFLGIALVKYWSRAAPRPVARAQAS